MTCANTALPAHAAIEFMMAGHEWLLHPHGGAMIYDPPLQNVKFWNTLRDNAIVSGNSQHPCEGAITQHIYVNERYILSDAPFFMAGTPGD